jgi:hypothetical protein
MKYDIDPALARDIDAFSQWLEAEMAEQERTVSWRIRCSLGGHFIGLAVVLWVAASKMSEAKAVLLMIAATAFFVIAAIKSLHASGVLSTFFLAMNCRYLATLLNDLKKNRRE